MGLVRVRWWMRRSGAEAGLSYARVFCLVRISGHSSLVGGGELRIGRKKEKTHCAVFTAGRFQDAIRPSSTVF